MAYFSAATLAHLWLSGSFVTSVTDDLTNSAESTQSLVEYNSDNLTLSSGTGSMDSLEAIAEGLLSAATSDQIVAEAIAEYVTNSEESTQSLVAYDSEAVTNSSESTQELVDVVALIEQISTDATSSHVTDEALAEGLTTNQTSTQTLDEVSSVVETMTNTSIATLAIDEVIESPFEPVESVRRGGGQTSMFLTPVLLLQRYEDILTSVATSTHVLDETIIPVQSAVESDKSWIDRMLGWLKGLIARDKAEANKEVPGFETISYLPHTTDSHKIERVYVAKTNTAPPPQPIVLPAPAPLSEEEVIEIDQYAQAREEDEMLLLGMFK